MSACAVLCMYHMYMYTICGLATFQNSMEPEMGALLFTRDRKSILYLHL